MIAVQYFCINYFFNYENKMLLKGNGLNSEFLQYVLPRNIRFNKIEVHSLGWLLHEIFDWNRTVRLSLLLRNHNEL